VAYVFEKSDGSWTQTQILTPSDGGQYGDQFGLGVALGGENIVVSSSFRDERADVDAGAAYVFRSVPSGTTFAWNSETGDWNDALNWTPHLVVPNSNQHEVIFAGSISNAETVYINSEVFVKSVEFENLQSYVVAGTGGGVLDAEMGNAIISVLQGSHQFQT